MTMGPLVAGSVLIIIYFVLSRTRDSFYVTIADEVFKLFLLGTYLVMPSTTVKIFQVFRCDEDVALDFDTDLEISDPSYRFSSANQKHGTWLSVDMQHECYNTTLGPDGNVISKEMDDDYRYYYWYSIIMILVYPIGIPLLYFVVLYKNKHTIDPGQEEMEILFAAEHGAKGAALAQDEAIAIRDDGPHSKRHKKYAFLYESYEPKCWWFELFECFRR